MRLATIQLDGVTAAARLDGETFAVLPYTDLADLLGRDDWRRLAGGEATGEVAYTRARLAPVVPRPEKVICVGLNYHGHAREAGMSLPGHPVIFAKYWRSLIGARDPLQLPPNSSEVDWEAELGVVIGRTARYVDEHEALDVIAGYTIVNDVSMRDWQLRTSQFLQGKTFEASTPVGPFLVTSDECDHARNAQLECAVDGRVMQSATTADMVFSPAQIVSYVSQIITLSPGDLIATGTPSGVGGAQVPPVYLEPGQVLTTSIEGLGEQQNLCLAPAAITV